MTKAGPNNISDFTSQLDYSIEATEERLAKLNDILNSPIEKNELYFPAQFFLDYFTNYYNPHVTQAANLSDKIPVCIGLSYMAGYLLFNKTESSDNIIKEKTQNYRNTKHISLQQVIEEQGEETLPQTAPPAQTKQVRPIITDEDRKNIPPLVDMYNFISALVLQIEKTTNSKEKYRLKKILIEARQDQYAIKECYTRPIRFQPDFTSTEYLFDEDTGYYKDNGEYHKVSTNTIDLSNPKHIYQLLNHYSALRHQHYDQPHSDMRYILDTLEELIEMTPLKELFSRVLVRRIDGATYEIIAKEIKDEFGMNLSVGYLSSTFANYIPKEIAKTYEQEYEDWYYIYAAKGDYKQCTGCGENKLRTPKYFRKDAKSNDGLSTKCKVCRKEMEEEKKRQKE
jgi:hypothetical protein